MTTQTSIFVSILVKVAPLLFIPLGLFVGTQISLITDFGLVHMVDNIKLNPDMFANQYAGSLVVCGWFSLAVTLIITIVAVREGLRWHGKKEKG